MELPKDKLPWDKYPNKDLRDYLGSQEVSSDTGYGTKTVDIDKKTGQPATGPNHTALGRYQMRNRTLVDAGWKNSDGSWTDKAKDAGVTSDDEFLANPDVQEKALTDVIDRNSMQLSSNGADRYVGTTIKDSNGNDLAITSDGLQAASHRAGAPTVRRYLDSGERGILLPKTINAIETRLRLKRR
jgi:hypothetical protein